VNLDLDVLIRNFTNSSQPPIALPPAIGGQSSAVAPPLPLPDLGSVPQSAGPDLLGGLLGLIGGGR
jgi:phospholipid/cholesterol/gamma-HCH transport system substrate-binding protein